MEISSIKSSAFYGYTATGSNATITGTFTTSSLPVIEVDGMYVTTNILSTVTTYTETTVTEYTSYTSTNSWSETVSSFSSTANRISSSQASHLGETYQVLDYTTQLTLYGYYYSETTSEVGYNTISTIFYTGITEVNGTNVSTSENSRIVNTGRVETTSNSKSGEHRGYKANGYNVEEVEQYSAVYTLSYSSGSLFKATQFLFSRGYLVTRAYINNSVVTSYQNTLNNIFNTYTVIYGNSTLASTATSARMSFNTYTLLYSGMFNSASVTN